MRATVLLVALVAGCAPKHAHTVWVSAIHVRGSTPTGKAPLGDPDLPPLDPAKPTTPAQARQTAMDARDALLYKNDHWWQYLPFGTVIQRRSGLDAGLLDADATRLRQWFADRGWADAQVAWDESPAREWWLFDRQHTHYVDITFTVLPGTREVRQIAQLDGIDGLPLALQLALQDVLPRPNDGTSPAQRQAAVDAVVRLLISARFPLAQVRVDVSGPLDERLEIYRVDRGPTPLTGAVTIEGADGLDASRLTRAVTRASHPGEPWDGVRLRSIARRLQAHPEIRTATVQPASQPGDDGRLPWTLALTTAPRTSHRIKSSLSASGAAIGLGLGVNWAVRDLGHGFGSLYGSSLVGYRLFDGPRGEFFTGITHGPATEHRITLEGAPTPLVPLSGFISAYGALDSYRGYVEVRALGEAGLRWRPSHLLSVGLFYRGEYATHFPWPWQADAFARGFAPSDAGGEGLLRSNDLHAAVLRLEYDSTDLGRLSTHGVRLNLEGIPYGVAAGEPFHRFAGDLVWYASAIPDRLVLVSRFWLGLNATADDGPDDGILVNRFFLGGTGSMRGFGFHMVGPPGSTGVRSDVLPGGDAMLYASLEARIRIHPDLYLGTFFDVGRTWASITDHVIDGVTVQRGIHLQDLQPVAGLGGIGRTPLGGLEVWLGVRLLRDAELVPNPPMASAQLVLDVGW